MNKYNWVEGKRQLLYNMIGLYLTCEGESIGIKELCWTMKV